MSALVGSSYRARRRRLGRVVLVVCTAIAVTVFIGLVVGLLLILGRGLADIGGALARNDQAFSDAFWNTVGISAAATCVAVLIGVCATIYVCEVTSNTTLARRFVASARALAALPAVAFGIIGMHIARLTEMHYFAVATLTLSLLAVPRIIVTTREALNSVPDSARMASYALGATRWRTVRDHVLPVAVRNIAGGVLATVGRTFGATAPLIMLASVTRVPATLPTEAVHAILFGGRTNTELAGAAIAVIVMVHFALTFSSSWLQRRLEVSRS